MANSNDLITIGDLELHDTDDEPFATGGLDRPDGALAVYRGDPQHMWIKNTGAATLWRRIHSMNNNTSEPGTDAIALGSNTTSSGVNSFAGGANSTASGNQSFAFGQSATADANHAVAIGRSADTGGFAAFNFADSAAGALVSTAANVLTLTFANGIEMGPNNSQDALYRFKQATDSTTNANPSTIASVPTETDTTLIISANVIGKRTGGAAGAAGDTATFKRTITVKNVGGTVTIPAAGIQDDYTYRDQATWDVAFSISGTDVDIDVNGAANNQVTWHMNYEIERA